MWWAFATGAGLGLSQTPHCFAMCGPLAWQAHRRREPAAQRVIYHAFRALGYLAVSFALVGLVELWTPLSVLLAAGAGSYLIWVALRPVPHRCPTAVQFQAVRPWWPAANRWSWPLHSAVLGLGNGLIPCGAVWAAALASASLGSGSSTAFMLGFAASTALPLLGFSWLLGHPSLRKLFAPRVLRGIMLLTGIWLLLRATEPLLPAAYQGHNSRMCSPLKI
ncbi:MAG: hypothetical protein RIR61_176 [Bacteroidota bacterium]|jgi:sulfite exporter TauE/SafE